MQNSRRKFIQNTGIALLGIGMTPSALWSKNTSADAKTLIGIQLYAVRDAMFKDPLGTLKALSKMGYQYIEHANYVNRKLYGYTPIEFKKILDDLGMKMPSGHTSLNANHWDANKKEFTAAWKYTIDDAVTLGQDYVISPWIDEKVRTSYDALMRQLEQFNLSGELCLESGMQFGYHNHNFEFIEKVNGQLIYDIILKETDPELVIHQLDFGNMFGIGARGMDWIKKYPGRFVSVHVKDEIKVPIGEMNDQHESTILGNGLVDPKAVCLLAKAIGGTKQFIIEQESYQGIAPLECARINLERIKTWGLV
ncbi:MAG: sugar phosphate isomerase/epimerase [Chitinophagia bacterium]|jgi:sugar phosphate isomerase/epimerase|nr:sugar phosphate isomerase/epimerase [Chitinophagia bacterium]